MLCLLLHSKWSAYCTFSNLVNACKVIALCLLFHFFQGLIFIFHFIRQLTASFVNFFSVFKYFFFLSFHFTYPFLQLKTEQILKRNLTSHKSRKIVPILNIVPSVKCTPSTRVRLSYICKKNNGE